MNWTATILSDTDIEIDLIVSADSYTEAQSNAYDAYDVKYGTIYGGVKLIMVAPGN